MPAAGSLTFEFLVLYKRLTNTSGAVPVPCQRFLGRYVPTQTLVAHRMPTGARPRRRACTARTVALALVAALCAGRGITGTASPTASASATRTVGSVVLHRCEEADAWCGTLSRALDPSGAVSGTLPIYFEYYPHEAPGRSQGLLVAAEGGPGFPTTESREPYR